MHDCLLWPQNSTISVSDFTGLKGLMRWKPWHCSILGESNTLSSLQQSECHHLDQELWGGMFHSQGRKETYNRSSLLSIVAKFLRFSFA